VTTRRESMTAPGAPPAVGPYSHAVKAGGLLFCSGQLPVDPDSGQVVEGSVADQARRCLDNLRVVCAAAGAQLTDVVRVGVYVTDMAVFAEVNEVYAAYFDDDPPARTTIAVAGLPLGAQVELDAVVALPG
jgi:2-iminobutanoate/2-iminopropanoate deaminase